MSLLLTLQINEPLLEPSRKPILYTTGYLGGGMTAKLVKQTSMGKVATFDAMVKRADLLVFDIRLNPWSMAPCWRKEAFCDRLYNADVFPDGRYIHVPELGNVNYKNGGDIKIADLRYGVESVLESCRCTGLNPLLLCGCDYYGDCHRRVVGRAFAGHARKWCEITCWANPPDLGHGESGDVFGVELTDEWKGQRQ